MDAAVALLLEQYGDVAAAGIISGGIIWRLHTLLMQAHADRIADRDAAQARADEMEARYAANMERRSQELERLANIMQKRGR